MRVGRALPIPDRARLPRDRTNMMPFYDPSGGSGKDRVIGAGGRGCPRPAATVREREGPRVRADPSLTLAARLRVWLRRALSTEVPRDPDSGETVGKARPGTSIDKGSPGPRMIPLREWMRRSIVSVVDHARPHDSMPVAWSDSR